MKRTLAVFAVLAVLAASVAYAQPIPPPPDAKAPQIGYHPKTWPIAVEKAEKVVAACRDPNNLKAIGLPESYQLTARDISCIMWSTIAARLRQSAKHLAHYRAPWVDVSLDKAEKLAARACYGGPGGDSPFANAIKNSGHGINYERRWLEVQPDIDMEAVRASAGKAASIIAMAGVILYGLADEMIPVP